MILVRPTIAGENVPDPGGAADGVPVASGSTMQITWDGFGPAVSQEWYIRNFGSVTVTQCCVIEFIWDKRPCKSNPAGVSHQVIRAGSSGESASWVKVAKANPQRYALMIGVFASVSGGAPTGTITID